MTAFRGASLGIGTYAGGGGAGVYAVADGWTLGAACPAALNASFGAYAPRFGLHYLVDERDAGAVGAYRSGESGWQRLACAAVAGAAPCHVALNHAQTALAVANYASGSVSLFRLDDDGLPLPPPQVHANTGRGPNPDRQEAPHAHWVGFSPDDRWLFQTDLGTDQVLAYPVVDGRLGTARIAYVAPPGSGPRHMLLHPRQPGRAYLVGELANTLTLLDRTDDRLTARTTRSTLPADWHGDSIVAHLAANRAGDRLYVSNRGHDSIAVFALAADGEPTLIQHAPAGGDYPRHFALLEDQGCMVIANEKAQTVTVLHLRADGTLAPTGISLAVPGAAYVFDTEPPR
ncbi:lactonase family protein [Sphingomonas ginsenosidivorax]|uniref:Lactonase family protein n=1 Tax=Sphingomonas ginsenosidivorax TaxID=862135 RepID=A0A5C6UHQ7_9SPHN|nr:beta-propeller fold lactonase family protein [Sphingomonas ginsenosidivorax]TXC71924.1 lactonase family protein [Sphingomonas ginsenosidivorax]